MQEEPWDEMFRDRLEEAISRKGLSQREIAKALGLHESAVSKWRSSTLPAADNLPGLCKLLGVSSDWLLGVEPREAAAPRRPPEETLAAALKSAPDEALEAAAARAGLPPERLLQLRDGQGLGDVTLREYGQIQEAMEAWGEAYDVPGPEAPEGAPVLAPVGSGHAEKEAEAPGPLRFEVAQVVRDKRTGEPIIPSTVPPDVAAAVRRAEAAAAHATATVNQLKRDLAKAQHERNMLEHGLPIHGTTPAAGTGRRRAKGRPKR